MADSEGKRRVRHGLIPMLVAIRMQETRKRREAEAAAKVESGTPPKPKKKGWF